MESDRKQMMDASPTTPVVKASDSIHPDLVWGSSPVMQEIRLKVHNLAQSDCPILIGGETGTGKGMVARAIHASSPRKSRPFVHVDCAALAPSMIESELYGHERGAFTGAMNRRVGRFELAEQGTVFLDEIAELPMELQVKLLRVLQDRCFERVGGIRTVRLGARIVAATNRALWNEVQENRFRSDLYYRIAVVGVELPPLRDRPQDIPDLVEEARRSISVRQGRVIRPPRAEALARLARYSWPGNVRELFNLVEHIAACWPDRPFDASLVEKVLEPISRIHLPSQVREGKTTQSDLEDVLRDCGGNVSQASRRLGMARTTLRRRLGRVNDSPS